MYIDADDELAPTALEECINAAKSNNSEIVFFDYCRFTIGKDKKYTYTNVLQLGDDAKLLTGDELRIRLLQRGACHCTAMYAKSVIVDNDLFYPEGVHYEDNAVAPVIQLIAHNPVKINSVLYRYRYDNLSITRTPNNYHFFDRIDTAVIMLNHMKRLGLYDRFKDLIDFIFINTYLTHTVFGAIYRFDKVQTDKIKLVSDGIKEYIPDYKQNIYYKSRPVKRKIKLYTHMHWPKIIKVLSNINRAIKRKPN